MQQQIKQIGKQQAVAEHRNQRKQPPKSRKMKKAAASGRVWGGGEIYVPI